MQQFFQGELSVETPEAFSSRLKLPFQSYHLLCRALTHRSYINENKDALEDNERLEFLGDAVLDFLVGAWLYHRFPEMKEGELTRLRSSLVRTEQLAEFARQIRLGDALRLGRGESRAGGRQRQALLCGAFEALVGALYIDSGLGAVSRFVEPMLISASKRILADHEDKDPKSLLQELVQAKGYLPPVYRTIAEDGPEHDKTFVVEVLLDDQSIGRGVGHSKQSAAKLAAIVALETLNNTW
ncbi:MAG TPA: ribonuclease III [Anaerolineales bacterium]|nr:ribonuclease III [Anaerolineales bacterium]